MEHRIRRALGACCALGLALSAAPALSADERPLFIATSENTRAPIGWVEFCAGTPGECGPHPGSPEEWTLTPKGWNHLVFVNRSVNQKIRPMTDLDHYGVVEKWSYPDDGYGDCEDYVLLKRRMLAQIGWPLQALLITIVRDTRGDGHAVLTVKTDKGEFILDNQNSEILLWSETKYHYVKRQAQHDPNIWISLGDPRPAMATATSR